MHLILGPLWNCSMPSCQARSQGFSLLELPPMRTGRPKQLSLLRIPIALSASALHRASEVSTNRRSLQYSQCQPQPMELYNDYTTVPSQDQRCWFPPSWHLWSHLQVKDFPHWSQSKKAIKGDCNLKRSNINENLSEIYKKSKGHDTTKGRQ